MKILMLLETDFPPDIRVENEINYLSGLGHEIHVACMTRRDRPAFEKTSYGYIYRQSVSSFIYKSSVAALTFPFYFKFWRQFAKKITSQKKFDAVHVHDLPLAQIGFELKKKKNIKFILDLHENWPSYIETASHTNNFPGRLLSHVSKWHVYETEMVKKADYVIAVVEEMRDRLILSGTDGRKIKVVPNTVKSENYTLPDESSDKSDHFILLYSGGMDSQRGLDVPIEGMQLLKNENVVLWIVGTGSYEKILKRYVDDHHLKDYVKFWGWQKPDRMFSLINQSDVAIIPYIRSVQTDCSSPNKLFQYMLAGKPVLASNCISLQRILNETNSGLCYTHNSSKDFVEKVIELKNNPEKIREFGKNGKEAVIKKYNWNNTAKPLEEIYQ